MTVRPAAVAIDSKMSVVEELLKLGDDSYADFQRKLVPSVDPESIIGIRVPVLRSFAKSFAKRPEAVDFLNELPHSYYDENMLHGFLISLINDFEKCVSLTDIFLPYVDNWAVCDTMSPKIFSKNRCELLPVIKKWVLSDRTFTCRYGVKTLMSFYLDDGFFREILEIPLNAKKDDFYVDMGVAWFFATALAKQWDDAVGYLENHKLDKWVHNKTIQKARESYRISQERKDYLIKLKL